MDSARVRLRVHSRWYLTLAISRVRCPPLFSSFIGCPHVRVFAAWHDLSWLMGLCVSPLLFVQVDVRLTRHLWLDSIRDLSLL